MTQELRALVLAAASIGFFHTLLGLLGVFFGLALKGLVGAESVRGGLVILFLGL